jgi:hypothetical protein
VNLALNNDRLFTTGAVTFFYVYNTFLDGRPNWNFNGKFVEICVQLTIIICIINFMYICFLQACMAFCMIVYMSALQQIEPECVSADLE